MGGTLCKDCPMKGKRDCMTLFAKTYFSSCTTYDIKEHGKRGSNKKDSV